MRITKSQLRRIVREAVSTMVNEAAYGHKVKSSIEREASAGSDQASAEDITSNVEDVSSTGDVTRVMQSVDDSDVSSAEDDILTQAISSTGEGGEGRQSQRTVWNPSRDDVYHTQRSPATGESGTTLTVGGKEVSMVSPEGRGALSNLGNPDIPSGKDYEEIIGTVTGDVYKETLKRWKKMIK